MPETETESQIAEEAAEIFFHPKIPALGGKAHLRQIADTGQATEQLDGRLYFRFRLKLQCGDLVWQQDFLLPFE